MGLSQPQIGQIRKKAIERGWEGTVNSPFLLSYVKDAPRLGYPRKNLPALTKQLITTVESNGIGRHAPLDELAYKLSVSVSSIHYYLRQLGYKKLKMSTKPGLTQQMRKARLRWALNYVNWTLEDWKNIIWINETSVVLRQQRGRRAVWRKRGQEYSEDVI